MDFSRSDISEIGHSTVPSHMRAAVIHKLGAASDIHVETIPTPPPGPDELLVKVDFCAVDPVDTFVRSGAYPTKMEFPFVIGRDIIGQVVAVGQNTHIRVGQWVWCNSLGHHGRQGGAAQYAVVAENRAYPIAEMDSARRAEFIAAVHPAATAYLAIAVHGQVQAGDAVVIEGGGGNVGACAIVIAASLGARVITTASSRDVERCRALGAEVAIDYRSADLYKQLATAADVDTGVDHARGVACHLDTSGRNRLDRTVGLMRMGGRIVIISGLGSASTAKLPVGQLYSRDCRIVGFAISNADSSVLADAARAITNLADKGELPSLRVQARPLSAAARTHEEIEAGKLRGRRVVLAVGEME